MKLIGLIASEEASAFLLTPTQAYFLLHLKRDLLSWGQTGFSNSFDGSRGSGNHAKSIDKYIYCHSESRLPPNIISDISQHMRPIAMNSNSVR